MRLERAYFGYIEGESFEKRICDPISHYPPYLYMFEVKDQT